MLKSAVIAVLLIRSASAIKCNNGSFVPGRKFVGESITCDAEASFCMSATVYNPDQSVKEISYGCGPTDQCDKVVEAVNQNTRLCSLERGNYCCVGEHNTAPAQICCCSTCGQKGDEAKGGQAAKSQATGLSSIVGSALLILGAFI